MGGIGYAAVNMRMRQFDSIYGSVSTMNHKSLAHYYKDIEAGKLPLERVFDHEPEDVKLVWLFQALQEMKINKVKYNEIFKTELNDDFADLWAVLSEKGWIEQDNVELRLINEGEFYVPLVQTLISHGRTQVITKENAELLKATL
jgi:oxygen-independent coproporphyrinogen-3 oxidase